MWIASASGQTDGDIRNMVWIYSSVHLSPVPTPLQVLVVIKSTNGRVIVKNATPISLATTYLFVLIPSLQPLLLLSTSIIFAIPPHPPSLMFAWVTHTSYPLSLLFEAECHVTLMYMHVHHRSCFVCVSYIARCPLSTPAASHNPAIR